LLAMTSGVIHADYPVVFPPAKPNSPNSNPM